MIRRLATALAAAALALSPGAAAQTLAVTGGKVVTNTSAGIIENGVVVIQNGRIVSVGRGPAPAGATVVDATGKWVTPGVFSALSRVGLTEISGEDSGNDVSAGGSDYQAALRASDGFNPDVSAIAVTRLEGITRLAIAGEPGRGLLGGFGALANTSGAFDSIDGEDAFMIATLGEAGAASAGGSQSAAWNWLLGAISDAKNYTRVYMAGHKEGDVLLRRDAAAFVPVVAGRVPLMIEAHNAADILQVLKLRELEPQMRLILLGAAEGWRVAPQIAAAGVPVIVNPMANLPDRFEMIASTKENAARLHAAGVTVAIADPGEATHNTRWLPQLAGNAVANGMPWQAAFEAISSTPAKMYGRTDLGVLSPGATADVVIWDGDPLELMSSPDAVWIAGQEQPMTSRQTELRDRYINPPDAVPHAYRNAP